MRLFTGACRVRWVARAVLVVASMAGVLITTATPALAHAELQRTTPTADSVVKTTPALIRLYFDESVTATADAVKLYDDHLQPVAAGRTFHPGGRGDLVAVAVPHPLRPGTYTVTWRVTSADTHVVSSGFRFSVGKRSVVTGSAPSTAVDDATTDVAGVVRGLGYAGLIAGPGALFVLMWLWPAGLSRRRIKRFLVLGGGLLALATLAGFVVQGALASGEPLSHAFGWDTIRLGFQGHFGRAGIERLVLLFALGQAVVVADRTLPAHRRAPYVGVFALLLFATWPYAGHASTGSLVPLAFVADWVHVAAMATWLGAVGLLLVGPLREPVRSETVKLIGSFSEWALAAMTLIVATGLFSAWRNVRAWGALTATTYGQILLWKSGAVLLVVAVAYLSRNWVRRAAQGRGEVDLRGLRRTVAAELAVAGVVLGLTAALTGSARAEEVYAPAFTRTATDGGTTVRVHVAATRVGRTTLEITTTQASGAPQPIRHIDGSLSALNPPIGPLPVRFRAAGAGREIATVTFADRGDWVLQVNVQTSPINEIAVSTTINVR